MKTYSAVLLFCVLFLYGQKPISKFSANASSLGSSNAVIHNELKQVINLSPFPNGEYIIVLTTDQGEIVSKKIIKK